MSFDRLAPVYRAMERVLAGDKLQRCRLTYLSQTKSARKALLLGEGAGRFIVPLLQTNPTVQITCVDASAGMLQQTQLALEAAGLSTERIEFIHADALHWQPTTGGYDLVSTHFFLDCFRAEQLNSLIPRLTSLITPDATWLISDFCVPAQGFSRLRARLILWLMYRFFRVVTRLPASHLVDYTAHMQQNGFQLAARQTYDWGLLRADCWQSIKST